jgi:hypothetical protein
MTHEQATKDQATERYLLGELPENERDAFEEHYFECAVCADDVRAASTLVGTMRVSARQAKPFLERQKARGWRKFAAPLAAAASLAIGILSMQFGVVAPMQTQVAALKQPFAPEELKLEETRAARQPVDSSRPIQLEIGIPTDAGPAPYGCAIVDRQGQVQKTFTATEERARGYFPIVYRAGGLKPGEYTIRVSDANGKVIREYPIAVR